MFSTEIELSQAFRELISTSEWSQSDFWEEVKGLSGIPDYVLVQKVNNNDIAIGIELKLENWQRAMKQAFRYRTFCDQSYVVLDSAHLSPALKSINEFKQYNIGLASIDYHLKELKIHFNPSIEEPFSSDLQQKLYKKITANN